MPKLIHSVFLLIVFSSLQQAIGQSSDFWRAVEDVDYLEARRALADQISTDPTSAENYFLDQLLDSYVLDEEFSFKRSKEAFDKSTDVEHYLQAMWNTPGVARSYQIHQVEHLAFFEEMTKSGKFDASLEAALSYGMGQVSLLRNQDAMKEAYWSSIKGIENWSYVGTFDNTSGSGYDADYAALHESSDASLFTNHVGATVKWFEPQVTVPDPYKSPEHFFYKKNKVYLAQSYIEIEEEGEYTIMVALGGQGKVYIDGELVIANEIEVSTTLDFFQTKLKLSKGQHRLFVQLGDTPDVSYSYFAVRFKDSANEVLDVKSAAFGKTDPNSLCEVLGEVPNKTIAYFQGKIEEAPIDPSSYIFLGKYYERNGMTNDAIKILKKGIASSPKNILLELELLTNYNSLQDMTTASIQIEKIRTLDKNAILIKYYDFAINIGNGNLSEARKIFEELKEGFGDFNTYTLDKQIELVQKENKYQEVIEVAAVAFEKHPHIANYNIYAYNIEKATSGDPTSAIKILEDYNKKYYDENLRKYMVKELKEMGKIDQARSYSEEHAKRFPYLYLNFTELGTQLYDKQQYEEALGYYKEALKIGPYMPVIYKDMATIYESLGNEELALGALEKALSYNPNYFALREKKNALTKQASFSQQLKRKDAEAEIRKALDSERHKKENYYYVFNDYKLLAFEQGPYIEFGELAIKIINDVGIDTWKTANVPYDSDYQSLNIEQAKLYKSTGEIANADRNKNEMVFGGLEAGDIIYIQYKIDNYASGKLYGSFFSSFTFDKFVPVEESVFNVSVPEKMELIFDLKNLPDTINAERSHGRKSYTWRLENLEKLADENYMPAVTELGKTISFSTIEKWDEIADWYSDVALKRSEVDYNVELAYENIFEGGEEWEPEKKAQAIYNYIQDNVAYSSVSFRQNGYVPQKPRTTLSEKLGDCKDVSLLFHTLASMAGISTNLVLVNTRDYGENSLVLPSNYFNHCIIKINLPEEEIYQEMTSASVAFGHVPSTLVNAQSLIVPNIDEVTKEQDLMNIPAPTQVQNYLKRKTEIAIESRNLTVKTKYDTKGNLALSSRTGFLGLDEDRRKEDVGYLINETYQKDIELLDYSIANLEEEEEDFTLTYSFTAGNEVLKLGGIRALKIPFFDLIINFKSFPDKERLYPFKYWNYETNDLYEDEIIVNFEGDIEVLDVPKSVVIKNKYIDYKIFVEQHETGKFTIKRSVKTVIEDIPASEYNAFRSMILEILEAEDMYIVYKEKK